MTPALSIVVPVHDRGDLLSRCLESLASWSAGYELVLVDDGSTDPRVAALRARTGASRWIDLAPGRGFGAAANRGLAEAAGGILLLLNSDTEVDPGGDEALLRAFATEPRLGAVGATLRFPDGRPQWSGGELPGTPWLFLLASGLGPLAGRVRRALGAQRESRDPTLPWLPATALALRRAAWDEAGPFDEGYAFYAQDLELCSRLDAARWTTRRLDAFRARHHLGGSIGAAGGAQEGQRLDLLWSDLARWAERRGTPRGARRALAAGGRLRLARLTGGSARLRAEREAVVRALASLRRGDAPIP